MYGVIGCEENELNVVKAIVYEWANDFGLSEYYDPSILAYHPFIPGHLHKALPKDCGMSVGTFFKGVLHRLVWNKGVLQLVCSVHSSQSIGIANYP